uniref:BPTI/Kunitz inhibitor domain-containing protein n=1 Tax=Amblyomma triste TaxID=251400 RepID=A0A023G9D0_AMBTT
MKAQVNFLIGLVCLMLVLVNGWERPEHCFLESYDGQCGTERPKIPRWYYDYSQSACAPFLWGGCGSNENNYGNCSACMTECSLHPEPVRACKEIIGAP